MTKEAITFKNVEEEDSKYKEQMELYKAFLMKQNPEIPEETAKKIVNHIDNFSATIEYILDKEVHKELPPLYSDIVTNIGILSGLILSHNICGGVWDLSDD